MCRRCRSTGLRFQSTLPAREATPYRAVCPGHNLISIHASREGSDKGTTEQQFQEYLFQSTLPAREATVGDFFSKCGPVDFNPRFPRGKRLIPAASSQRNFTISIHASREGSDASCTHLTAHCLISIHASREGSDRSESKQWVIVRDFNPRFPRGKRHQRALLAFEGKGISIHASREGSDLPFPDDEEDEEISIHASREGSDNHGRH